MHSEFNMYSLKYNDYRTTCIYAMRRIQLNSAVSAYMLLHQLLRQIILFKNEIDVYKKMKMNDELMSLLGI